MVVVGRPFGGLDIGELFCEKIDSIFLRLSQKMAVKLQSRCTVGNKRNLYLSIFFTEMTWKRYTRYLNICCRRGWVLRKYNIQQSSCETQKKNRKHQSDWKTFDDISCWRARYEAENNISPTRYFRYLGIKIVINSYFLIFPTVSQIWNT